MKYSVIITLLFLVNAIALNAQETFKLSFEKPHDTLRKKETGSIHSVTLKLESVKIDEDSLSLYTISIKSVDEKSTIAKSEYELIWWCV